MQQRTVIGQIVVLIETARGFRRAADETTDRVYCASFVQAALALEGRAATLGQSLSVAG